MSEMVVPDGWEVKRLGDISDVVTKGTTPKSYTTSGINFIKVESLTESGKLDATKFAYISDETYFTELKRSQLKEGDLLISIAGSLGRSVIVDKKHLPANTNQAVSIVRLREKDIDRRYCLFFVNSEYIKNEIRSLQTVGAQPNLSLKQVSEFQIHTPSVHEQQKIASILTSVDEVIEKTQSQINKLQDLKKGTMNELLTKGIGHTEFKDSPVGKIPVEWEVKSISSLINTISGYAFSSSEFVERGRLCIRMGTLYNSKFRENRSPVYVPESFMDKYKRFNVTTGDLLMSMTGTAGKRDYGFIVEVPETFQGGLLNQRVIKIVSKQSTSKKYILQLMRSRLYLEKLYSFGSGTKQANLSVAQISGILVPIPSFDEQEKIGTAILSIEHTIEEKQRKLEQTQSLKKSLMQDLLTGKVRVTVH